MEKKKIKVLQYVSCMNRAGAETLLINIYRNIDRDKFEFHFISHTKEKCDYDDEIRALGGKVIYLERPKLNKIKKYKRDFSNIVKENGPYDAIHTHMQLINGLILKVAKELGIKNRISHAHSNGDYNKGSIFRKCYRIYSKNLIKNNATKNLACSIQSGEYLYEKRHFILLNNAIDLNNFDLGNKYEKYINKELGISNEIKIITHIGRFVEVKNHRFIIKVFSELIKKSKEYRLILCGDGPLKNEIKNLVEKLNLRKYVYFLGVRDDINKILLGTDIYFMPSVLEGLPVVLIEAQAAGCQCLISDIIPKECDMKMKLISYESINSKIEIWVKKIIDLERKNIDFNIRKKYINDNGYNLEENISILSNVYLEN